MAAKKDDKKKLRRGGYYWLEGTPYVTVTNVLRVIDKPALRYWVGREVYLAMVQDPTMSKEEALRSPYKKTKAGAERGSAVHSIVEAWKNTAKVIPNVPEPYKPYAQAFYNYVSDNDLKLEEHEKTVVSKTHGFAGTLDLIVQQNKGEGLWIIDIKTGKDIYKEAHIQLSAYKHALNEDYGMDIKRTGVLLLQETGNYKFEETADCFDAFLACLELWKFLNKESATKVGYLKEVNETV
jgi:hypothetical protein